MSRPGTMEQASMIAFHLLHRSLPGKRTNVIRRCRMAQAIAEAICQRFGSGPYQWKFKECEWYLDIKTLSLSDSRRYQHWLVLRELIYSLGHAEWILRLEKRKNAGYLRLTGKSGQLKAGRPAKLPCQSE